MKLKIISLVGASLMTVGGAACAADGQALFAANCAKCHGADGKPTKMGLKVGAPDLSDAKVQAQMTDDKIATSIKEGIKDGDKVKMKAFPDLSADDIKALVAYVRTFKK